MSELILPGDLPEHDPAIDALRQSAALQEALALLRQSVDTLSPAVNRASRMDGWEQFGTQEWAAQKEVRTGMACLVQAIEWFLVAQRSLKG